MEHYKTTIIPEKENKVLDYISCDLCGAKAKNGYYGNSIWDVEELEIKTEVRHREGKSYPEGGWGSEYAVHICPNCFDTKLIPWLESQGCKVIPKEWDY